MREDIDNEAFRADLLARLEEIDAIAATRAAAGETVELDQSRTGRLSRMDAMQAQAMARAGSERLDQERRRIRAALQRLDSGDYGYCLDCDEPIPPGRLQVDPAAGLCLACATRREHKS